MKHIHQILFLFVFTASLTAGVWLGARAGRANNPSRSANSTEGYSGINELASEASQQRSILIIGADHLDAPNPRLLGLWMVLYLPTSPGITFMPIYPDQFENLDYALGLNPDRTPAGDFLAALHSMDIKWTNYVLIDEVGLAEMVDLVGGFQVEEHRIDGLRAVASVQPVWEDHQSARLGQMVFIKRLCNQVATINTLPNPAKVIQLSAHHLSTDLNPDMILSDWSALTASGGLGCKFPTLESLQP